MSISWYGNKIPKRRGIEKLTRNKGGGKFEPECRGLDGNNPF